MGKDLKDILKAAMIIGMAAVAFYLVYPKYELHPTRWHIRINTITGTVEYGDVGEKWERWGVPESKAEKDEYKKKERFIFTDRPGSDTITLEDDDQKD